MSAKKAADGQACADNYSFGGQAVIEGVMMRGRHSWAVAVRRPSGGIARMAFPLDPPGSSHRFWRLPVVRGVVALYDSLSLGIRALSIAANVSLEDPEPKVADASGDAGQAIETAEKTAAPGTGSAKGFGFKEMAGTLLISVCFAVGLFVVVPLFVVKTFESTFSNAFVFNLVEGLIRIAIFIVYIWVVSLIPDLRRVFEYHGAEHKVIHAYEACRRPDAEEASHYSTLHPRCGTGFLLLVLVIAVILFAVVGKPALPYLVLSRIIGIPVIVGVAYEVGIKWAGKRASGSVARVLLWPGMQLQRLTTRQPSADQLEVAAAALEEVIALDQARQAAPSKEDIPAID